MIEKFIETLCKELTIDLPQKDGSGAYPLAISELDAFLLRPLESGFTCQMAIGKLSEESREDRLMNLMSANYLGQGTGGAVLGMESNEKSLTLSLYLPYEMTYKAFKERIEEFVNYANYWREQI